MILSRIKRYFDGTTVETNRVAIVEDEVNGLSKYVIADVTLYRDGRIRADRLEERWSVGGREVVSVGWIFSSDVPVVSSPEDAFDPETLNTYTDKGGSDE